MAASFDFGMIGLGVMGSNLLLNMADKGYAAIGFDLKPERGQALEAAANKGTIVKGVNTLTELVASLKTPRKIMMLVPAGKPVDDVIASLLPLLEKGDIVIDGGNSYFKDTLHRIDYLKDKGLHFFGMGVSGGEMGARTGPSMMPGGDKAAYEYLRPVLESIAAKSNGKPCVAYMGNNAAGHYVKMVHNGIEYALMQIISEAYDLLKRGARFTNLELYEIFDIWNKGPLQSFLIEITAAIFKTGDSATEGNDDFLLDKILDKAGSKGTGKWTSQDAMNLPVPVPVIDMAVAMRDLSVYKNERQNIAAQYKPAVANLEFQKEKLVRELESSLEFCFLLTYAQGLHMLEKASEVYGMNIPLPDVIQVWKAGCIIRSELLQHFVQADATAATANVLLGESITQRINATENSARHLAALALQSRIPVPCIAACVSYFDAFCSERLPVNLIQAQRDFFGAHTYQRIDKEGVFHTEWQSGEVPVK